MVLIATLATLPSVAAEAVTTVVVTGPTAIGFFPPVSKEEIDSDDGGIREGTSHVAFALEDLQKCLAPLKLATSLEFTRAITIKVGATVHRMKFASDSAHAVGIVLAVPGKAPEVVYATAGPSSLLYLAPQVAWKYFSEPNCKR
jgi:hypothetical protein